GSSPAEGLSSVSVASVFAPVPAQSILGTDGQELRLTVVVTTTQTSRPASDESSDTTWRRVGHHLFRLSSFELGFILFAVLLGATGLGIFLGHRVKHLSDDLKEPFGILQGALLGLVGLLLAFGLSLAVNRYEDRRANVVSETNAIGTTYLR